MIGQRGTQPHAGAFFKCLFASASFLRILSAAAAMSRCPDALFQTSSSAAGRMGGWRLTAASCVELAESVLGIVLHQRELLYSSLYFFPESSLEPATSVYMPIDSGQISSVIPAQEFPHGISWHHCYKCMAPDLRSVTNPASLTSITSVFLSDFPAPNTVFSIQGFEYP